MPKLRIIDDELWGQVKSRQLAIRALTDGRQSKFKRARRPTFLFSGLAKCAECGGGYVMFWRDRLACFNARSRGTCMIVVDEPLLKDASEMTLVQPNHPIQTLTRRIVPISRSQNAFVAIRRVDAVDGILGCRAASPPPLRRHTNALTNDINGALRCRSLSTLQRAAPTHWRQSLAAL